LRGTEGIGFCGMDVYVMQDGARRGPFPPFRLTEMLEEGSLTPQHLVWHDGMEQWTPLGEAPSLRTVLKNPAPAPAEETMDTADGPPVPPPLPRTAQLSAALALQVLRDRRRLAWRRFFARQMDLTLAMGLFVAAGIPLGIADVWTVMLHPWWLPVAVLGGWIVLEALLLATVGTTPGRALLGIRVFAEGDTKPGFGAALKRSALVFVAGAGMGLPLNYLLPLAQWMFAFWNFQKFGQTLWDKSCGTRVASRQLTGWHAGGIAAVIAGVVGFQFWLVLTAPLPVRLSEEDRKAVLEQRKEFSSVMDQVSPKK
jgi:uncharacterized RDD family membrane protein YckC